MKKINTTKLVALLAALCLMTSAFVGGTLAKYTTEVTGNDSARVAFWGFNESDALTINLFDGTYTNVLSGDTTQNVIAPGTNDATSFNFSYKDYTGNAKVTAPEVGYKFTVTAAVTGLEGAATDTDALDANPNFKWTVTLPGGTAEEFDTVAKMVEKLQSLNGTYEAGKLPTGFDAGDNTFTVAWDWAFETTDNVDTADVDEMAKQDAIDTAMGNSDDLDDLVLTITINATQLN